MEKFKYDLAVIGLGYVGLPLAVEATRSNLKVVGYDTAEDIVNSINNSISLIEDISQEELSDALGNGFIASNDDSVLGDAEFVIISVPTPLTDYQPDLQYVKAAAASIGRNLKDSQVIILESTTYPGTTEEVLVPEIKKHSDKVPGEDYFVGYSPERIDPGNKKWRFRNTPKVVSGINLQSLKKIEDFYKRIVDEVVVVSGTREAEMVKLLENTYRHVNIALINELAILCDMLNLDIWEVVNAAGTKPFGFESFHPGPGVGGHCIPIDPQYLSFKTRQIGQPVRFVELAQEINNSMPAYVCDRVSLFLNDLGMPVKNSRILIYGVAYKPDIGDVRESPAFEIIEILSGKGAEVDYFDPFVEEFKLESRDLVSIDSRHELKDYDMLLILTLHSETNIEKINNSETPVFDTTGSDKITNSTKI
jgi:nucleotide sugar dehydrogenase